MSRNYTPDEMADIEASYADNPDIEVLTIKIPVSKTAFGKATPEQIESAALDAATAVRGACRRRGWGVPASESAE